MPNIPREYFHGDNELAPTYKVKTPYKHPQKSLLSVHHFVVKFKYACIDQPHPDPGGISLVEGIV